MTWLCWLICLDWDFQYHDFMCFVDIFVWDIDMLDCCWLIVLYCLAHWLWYLPWLFWSPCIYGFIVIHRLIWHVDCLDYIFSCLSLCRVFVSLFHPICHSLYVCMSDISCTLPDCMSHDCPFSAWLHVICLCGSHFYPPISNSLGFGHFFHLGSHYCKCETFCVLALWPSWRLGIGSATGYIDAREHSGRERHFVVN